MMSGEPTAGERCSVGGSVIERVGKSVEIGQCIHIAERL